MSFIIGPDNKISTCDATDVSNRIVFGRRITVCFNKFLEKPGFDLHHEQEAGTVVLKASKGISSAYEAAAYAEFNDLLKGPDPPRVAVGMLGSVWVDLFLAGRLVRLALEAGKTQWTLLLIALE